MLTYTKLLLTNIHCYVTSHNYLKTRQEVALEWLDVKSNSLSLWNLTIDRNSIPVDLYLLHIPFA